MKNTKRKKDQQDIKKMKFKLLSLITFFSLLIIATVFFFYSYQIEKFAQALTGDYSKSTGGTLSASEWNNLDDDFVDASGDDITGNLTVSGNLGVGTTNPTGKLHFKASSTSYGTGGIRFEQSADSSYWDIMPAYNSLYFGYNSGTKLEFTSTGTIKMQDGQYIGNLNGVHATFDDTNDYLEITGGNVGIGDSTPDTRLDVLGSSIYPIYTKSSEAQSFIRFFTGSTTARGSIGYSSAGSGGLGFLNAASSAINLLVTDAGNVGIGTTAPAATLDVEKNTNGVNGIYLINPNTGTAARSLYLIGQASTGGNYMFHQHLSDNYTTDGLWVANRSTISAGDAGGLLIETVGASPIIFSTNGHETSDERMRIDSSGNVGIGTTAPEAKLHITKNEYAEGVTGVNDDLIFEDNAYAYFNLVAPTGAGIWFSDDAYQRAGLYYTHADDKFYFYDAGTAKMTIYNNYAGVGTTSPEARWHVKDTTAVQMKLQGDSNYRMTFFEDTSDVSNIYNHNGTSLGDINIGQTSGSAGIYYDGSEQRVGIGTANPDAKLHVVGNASIVQNSPNTAILKLTGGNSAVTANGEINTKIDFGSNDGSVLNGIGGRITTVTEATNGARVGMGFETYYQTESADPIERMRITNTGNVGIGTTVPESQLHILKTGAVANTDGITLENTTANEKYMLMAGILGTTSSGFSIYDKTNLATRLAISNAGNVGIGTGSPGAKLEVDGETRFGYDANNYWKWNNQYADMIRGNSGVNWNFRTIFSSYTSDDAGGFTFSPRNSNAMTIKGSNGYVGIGTITPGYTLEVNGTAGKTGGGSWSDSSDKRLKKNIYNLDSAYALDKISQLQGVNYEWINPEEHSEGVKAGVIAQNLEEVFPEWVEEIDPHGNDVDLVPEGEKIKSIHFPHDFNAYVIEAIKELKKQNESLKEIVCADHPGEEICK